MALKARIYDTSWNELSTSASLTWMPSAVQPNDSVTMTGSIPALTPGKTYRVCWDLYLNGTTSLESSYGVPFGTCTDLAPGDTPPSIDSEAPPSNTTVGTVTPQLYASGHDPDNYPGTGLTYDFQVYTNPTTGSPSLVADSGWITSTSWSVPDGKLAWNSSYLWQAAVSDGLAPSAWSNAAPSPSPCSSR